MTHEWISHDGMVHLYRADSIAMLESLDADTIDTVITDPPYGVDVANNKAFDDTADAFYSTSPPLIEWADGHELAVLAFHCAVPLARDLAAFHRPPDRTLIWSPTFSMSASRCNEIFYRWHPIHCWNLPAKHDGPKVDILRHNTDCGAWWNHPGTKPIGLMHDLVRISAGAVLDPFMGSGTTGVACVQNGKPFIGIERDASYFAIAVRRIKEAIAEGGLFNGQMDDAEPELLFNEEATR